MKRGRGSALTRVLGGGACLALSLACAGTSAFAEPASRGEPAVVDSFDNAAMDYWRAAALMQPALSLEEFQFIEFAEGPLLALPPRIFSTRPLIARWLLLERPMLNALATGAEKTHCLFDPPTDYPMVEELFSMCVRPLTLRGLAVAKAAEFVENERLAATIYVNLLRMADHIHEDLSWAHARSAMNVLQQVLVDLEGFCSREPPTRAVQILSDYFEDLDRPRFPVGDYLRKESERYADWLEIDIREAPAKLERLYGEAELMPAVDKLVTLERDEQRERLRGWVAEYRKLCEQLANVMAQPYERALPLLEKADEQLDKWRADPAAPGVNPLLPLLVPPLTGLYERFLLAEAQWTMAEIAVMAAAYKDFTRVWPASLEELQRFSERSFASDPFSGRPFLYALHRGQPRVSCRAPREMARRPDLVTSLDFHERQEEDRVNLEAIVGPREEEEAVHRLPPDAPVAR